MDKKSEQYKGVNPALQGVVWGAAFAAGSVAAFCLVSKNASMVAAVAAGVIPSLVAGSAAHSFAKEAKQQFQENQSTISEQAHIISEAKNQGLIETHTVVTKGPAV